MFGVALVLPGAAQPALAAALGLDLADSGLVASALSLGLGVGVVAGGPLADRWARRPLFVGAAALAALAGLGVALAGLALPLAPSFAGALLATAGIGVGCGLYETLLNAAVPERRPERAAARLSLLHACATLGAGLGAPALGAVSEAHGLGASYGALGVAFAALAGLGLAVRFPAPPRPGAAPAGAAPRLAPLTPWLWVSFAYVGLETALSVFAAPFAASADRGSLRGMHALSAFWLGLLAARLAFGALGRPAGAGQLRAAGAAGALALATAAARPGLPPELVYAAAGLALGVVFPLLVVLAGDAAPERRATAVGLVVGAGSLGGLVVPWLTGMIGDRWGAPALVGTLSLLAASVAVAASPRRAAPRD